MPNSISKLILLALPAAFVPRFSASAAKPLQWKLLKATLTYHVSTALHQVNGVSKMAKGKGVCHSGQCSFLAAAPVNSFHSGDTNRDLHMIQSVRGAVYPMVIVRTQIPEAAIHPGPLRAKLQIQFAGHTVNYNQVAFQLIQQGKNYRLTGTIPAKLSDFQIPPPEFLFLKVANPIPVAVNMLWTQTG